MLFKPLISNKNSLKLFAFASKHTFGGKTNKPFFVKMFVNIVIKKLTCQI